MVTGAPEGTAWRVRDGGVGESRREWRLENGTGGMHDLALDGTLVMLAAPEKAMAPVLVNSIFGAVVPITAPSAQRLAALVPEPMVKSRLVT